MSRLVDSERVLADLEREAMKTADILESLRRSLALEPASADEIEAELRRDRFQPHAILTREESRLQRDLEQDGGSDEDRN